MPVITLIIKSQLRGPPHAHHAPYLVSRSTSQVPEDFFNISDTLLAGISALIGFLALAVALLQLCRYRNRRAFHRLNHVFELDAAVPGVYILI